MCSGLKEVLLVKRKSSIERWNKSSVFYAHVVWFGTNGEVSPRYVGLFSLVGVSLGPFRVHTRCTQHLVCSGAE